jgi:hypothetical protein
MTTYKTYEAQIYDKVKNNETQQQVLDRIGYVPEAECNEYVLTLAR